MSKKTKEQLEQENQDLRDEVEFLRELAKKLADRPVAAPAPIQPLPYYPPINPNGIWIGPNTTPPNDIQITCSNNLGELVIDDNSNQIRIGSYTSAGQLQL